MLTRKSYYMCDLDHVRNEQGFYIMPFMVMSKQKMKMFMCIIFLDATVLPPE